MTAAQTTVRCMYRGRAVKPFNKVCQNDRRFKMAKKSFFFVMFVMVAVCGAFAQSDTDWSKAEGANPRAIKNSLQQKLDLLGKQTGIPPKIRWGFRDEKDRAVIVARSYSDSSVYRVRDDGSIVRRSDGKIMVARPGNSPHERGEAVDLHNGDKYSPEQLRAAGLRHDPILDEPWHIIEQ
jgi:hypothetical protein